MGTQIGDRQESIPVVVEIFTAVGTLGEIFVFSGPDAYYPNGIVEVAFKDTDNNWKDYPSSKYVESIGGLAVAFVHDFRANAGTLVRVTYRSPSAGTNTTPAGFVYLGPEEGADDDMIAYPHEVGVATPGYFDCSHYRTIHSRLTTDTAAGLADGEYSIEFSDLTDFSVVNLRLTVPIDCTTLLTVDDISTDPATTLAYEDLHSAVMGKYCRVIVRNWDATPLELWQVVIRGEP